MYCPKCGKELKAGAKFCPNCGAKIQVSAPQPSDIQPEPVKQEPAKPENPVNTDETVQPEMPVETAPVKPEIPVAAPVPPAPVKEKPVAAPVPPAPETTMQSDKISKKEEKRQKKASKKKGGGILTALTVIFLLLAIGITAGSFVYTNVIQEPLDQIVLETETEGNIEETTVAETAEK